MKLIFGTKMQHEGTMMHVYFVFRNFLYFLNNAKKTFSWHFLVIVFLLMRFLRDCWWDDADIWLISRLWSCNSDSASDPQWRSHVTCCTFVFRLRQEIHVVQETKGYGYVNSGTSFTNCGFFCCRCWDSWQCCWWWWPALSQENWQLQFVYW